MRAVNRTERDYEIRESSPGNWFWRVFDRVTGKTIIWGDCLPTADRAKAAAERQLFAPPEDDE